MDHKQQRAVLTHHFQELLRASKSRLDANGPLAGSDRTAAENTVAFIEHDLEGAGPVSSEQDRESVLRFVRRYDLPAELANSANFSRVFKQAHRDFAKALLSYSDGLESFDFSVAGGAHANDVSSSGKQGISLRQAADLYRKECVLTGEWTERTENEKVEYLQVLFEILGEDTDISTITTEDANRVKTALQQYPKNRRKHPATRELNLEQALLVEGVERLQVPTLNKYMQTYKGLFGWAVPHHHAATNLFDGMIFKQSKRQKEEAKRLPFSPAQVRTIYARVLLEPAADPQFEYRRWGPLIAMFTGARLNEISQLMLKDLRHEDGITYFDLNDDGDRKSVKSSASKRQVPMHSRLIQLGLPDHVERLRSKGATKLFPMLNYCPTNGWGRALGRWVNQSLLVELGLKGDSKLSFHSFRHTVATELYRANVEHPIVQSIMGHERDGVTQNTYFSQGYTLKQRADALEQLQYGE